MTVRFEIKDQLARLLAQEDLIVEHKDVPTASFDVDRRILILPNWNRASESVYDLLVGHEVGHALYTPNEDFSHVGAPKSYLNVTEDARIEKLIKRRFPGLAKCFFRGYNELNRNDFFGINDEDITKLSLIDRINLYFKGNLDIKFTEQEQKFVDMVSVEETFEDACQAAREIFIYSKEQYKKEENIDLSDFPQNDNGVSGGESEQSFSEEFEENESENDGEQEQQGDSDKSGGTFGGDTYEEAITDTNFQEQVEKLCGYNRGDTIYVEVPEVKLENIIVLPNVVWENFEVESKANEVCVQDSTVTYLRQKYCEFKKSAQKEVGYLVKEFECRKSATAYSRASTSRTGVLDTSKLHTYKFNEDLFKKVTIVPDGKSHGLIFILDWSGSMTQVLTDTVKQLLNLVFFCRKVNIPFEVYAFTNEWIRNSSNFRDFGYGWNSMFRNQEPKVNDLIVGSCFSLLNFLSSKTKSKDFERHCENLFILSHQPYDYGQLSLSGTPLNEAVISLHQIIPQFKKANGVEKVNAIILTDGESQCIPYVIKFSKGDDQEVFGYNNMSDRCVLRDRKLGRVYTSMSRFTDNTPVLLKHLSEKFPEVNIIGIRLVGGSDLARYLRNRDVEDICDIMAKWKKNKSVSIKGLGYTKLFALSSKSLSQNSEFEVAEDATKSQIKTAFVKSLNSKKLNRKILSEFVELIA